MHYCLLRNYSVSCISAQQQLHLSICATLCMTLRGLTGCQSLGRHCRTDWNVCNGKSEDAVAVGSEGRVIDTFTLRLFERKTGDGLAVLARDNWAVSFVSSWVPLLLFTLSASIYLAKENCLLGMAAGANGWSLGVWGVQLFIVIDSRGPWESTTRIMHIFHGRLFRLCLQV